ncbi:MAG: hypothetical protein ACM338_10590 [Betaproteobacteria bacterium]
MTQFVLVHGTWHGGWCWARVLRLLRAPGHAAHAVTLTGVGEHGGVVITGVADALQRRRPGLLRHLVCVDAAVPLPGESWSSTRAPEVVALATGHDPMVSAPREFASILPDCAG